MLGYIKLSLCIRLNLIVFETGGNIFYLAVIEGALFIFEFQVDDYICSVYLISLFSYRRGVSYFRCQYIYIETFIL